MNRPLLLLFCSLFLLFGCGAGSLTVPSGFTLEKIAEISGARTIAFAPSGDLFVGTAGGDVYIVPGAGGNSPGKAEVFASPGDAPAAGVAFSGGYLYVGTQHAIWRLPYRSGERHARSIEKLTTVRSGSPPAGSDGDVHSSTSVAAHGQDVYASIGSSCNACVETDPTRATIGRIRNGRYEVIGKRNRNAIALTVNENTGSLWAGTAGEDDLPPGHPYEIFDDVTGTLPADYGWPFCYENRKANPVPTWSGESCAKTVVPRVVFPAYETPTAAAFYPLRARGRYAFPQQYAGGAFVALHGSWHGPRQGLPGFLPPRVVFVPMRGDTPVHPVNWSDPRVQWSEFVGGYQEGGSAHRYGRPAGVAVGPQGDLFVSDDDTGAIYRIRHSQ